MQLALRSGVSFCLIGGRPMFLDIVKDRYFCLSADAECRFAALVRSEGTVSAQDPSLTRLMARGLLVEAHATAGLSACKSPPLPEESVLDHALPPSNFIQSATALRRVAGIKTQLRLIGLARTLAAIDDRKSRTLATADGAEVLIERTMASFARAARVSTILDNCLCQSLAVARQLLAHRVRPDIVLGVRLGPFAAHCWVQHDNRIVNDRFDLVRTFTPILVI